MAQGYITQEKDYWIHSNALSITLNALGNANRIQCSVSSGAVIMAFIEGDTTLGYNAAHNYKSWPLTASPTYFNTNTAKYVYVAIPKTDAIGTQAVVVFPSERLDIDGKNESDEQIGSTDYLYIYIGAKISATDGTTQRTWESEVKTGKLDTDQGRDEERYETEWYSWITVMQTVTFLKKISMSATSWFDNLRLGSSSNNLTGVATNATTAEYVDADYLVATPSYIKEYALSRKGNDTASGLITFLQGIKIGVQQLFGITADGDATLNDVAAGGDVYAGGDIMSDGDIEADGDITAGGKMTAAEMIANYLHTVGFTPESGLAGLGFGVTTDQNGKATVQTDDLIVLGQMIVNSLNIREVSYIGGVYLLTPAGSTVQRIVPLYSNTPSDTRTWTTEDNGQPAVGYRIMWAADNGTTFTMNFWKQGDQAFCETFNIAEPGQYEHVSNSRYWRMVCKTGQVAVDGQMQHFADLANTAVVYLYDNDGNPVRNVAGGTAFLGYENNRGTVPAVDDKVVCLGSQADARRQAAIQLSAEGTGSIGIYDDIDDYSPLTTHEVHFFSKDAVRMRAGRFSWTTNSGINTPPTIYCGEWTEGNISEWGYEWTYNGVNWLCVIPQGQTTNEAPGTTPDYWVSNKGEKGDKGDDGKSVARLVLDRTMLTVKTDSDGKVMEKVDMTIPFKVMVNGELLAIESSSIDEGGQSHYVTLTRSTV